MKLGLMIGAGIGVTFGHDVAAVESRDEKVAERCPEAMPSRPAQSRHEGALMVAPVVASYSPMVPAEFLARKRRLFEPMAMPAGIPICGPLMKVESMVAPVVALYWPTTAPTANRWLL